MAISDWGHPSGLMGRSTISNDTLGQTRLVSYVTAAGVETREPQRQVRLNNATGAATVLGGVYMLSFGATEATLFNAVAGSAQAVGAETQMVVAMGVVANGSNGWFAWAGLVDALVEGTTAVAVADFLKFVTATSGNGFIKDGTTRTTKTFAKAYAAQGSAGTVLTKLLMLGDRADPD